MTSMPSKLPDGVTRDEAQPLVGYRSNGEWNDLVAQVGAMVAGIDGIIDDEVRGHILGILQGVDEIHREGLHRLVRLFKDGVLEQVISDPAIRTLFGMYDLLPEDEPGCTKTVNFLTPEEQAGTDTKPLPAKPTAVHARVASVAAPVLPHWLPAPLAQTLADGAHTLVVGHGTAIVVARVRGEHFAFEAGCPHHNKPLEDGRLNGYTWICPAEPGCAYDIRNGARIGGGPHLQCHTVRADDQGRILIGFGMPFQARMPSF